MFFCHSHIELRQIEVEVKLSGIIQSPFKGEFNSFLFLKLFLSSSAVSLLLFFYYFAKKKSPDFLSFLLPEAHL